MGASLSSFNPPPPPLGEFALHDTFHGHVKLVNSLRFSPDGQLLASGGDDSLVGAVFKPAVAFQAHSTAIEGIDFDPVRRRLATVADGIVRVWSPDERNPSVMRNIGFSASQGFIARTVHFAEGGKTVIISYLDSHEMQAPKIESHILYRTMEVHPEWTSIQSHLSYLSSAHTALSTGTEILLVHNLTTGVDAYSLPAMNLVGTFRAPVIRRYPKQVAFGARDSLVVHGSDSGAVYVYDYASTDLVQTLCHTDVLIQAVTTHSGNGMHFIASAASEGNFSVKVWSKKKVISEGRTDSRTVKS
ncbi:hypothetical protein M422DRAFT_44407 [Sphaerobolus stellatus SS14]|nr:hypothetical protein M422DRAFT_44407 [Sphaerobolus stellatus SS14]